MRCQRTDEGLIRFPLAGGLVVLAALIGTLGIAPMTPKPKSRSEANKVIDKGGEYVSPDGMCRAKLKIASMGGFLSLTAGESGAKNLTVNDITGMAWVGNHSLIYATSPIYGVPGLYVYGCESNKPRRIVGARTITGAYPDGADFFELERISDKKPVTVYFFYAPDVDEVDFDKFKTPSYLFQVHLDGTDFRKAESP